MPDKVTIEVNARDAGFMLARQVSHAFYAVYVYKDAQSRLAANASQGGSSAGNAFARMVETRTKADYARQGAGNAQMCLIGSSLPRTIRAVMRVRKAATALFFRPLVLMRKNKHDRIDWAYYERLNSKAFKIIDAALELDLAELQKTDYAISINNRAVCDGQISLDGSLCGSINIVVHREDYVVCQDCGLASRLTPAKPDQYLGSEASRFAASKSTITEVEREAPTNFLRIDSEGVTQVTKEEMKRETRITVKGTAAPAPGKFICIEPVGISGKTCGSTSFVVEDGHVVCGECKTYWTTEEMVDVRDGMFEFLRDLRDSGAIRLLGAAQYIVDEFDIDENVAQAWLNAWTSGFDEESN